MGSRKKGVSKEDKLIRAVEFFHEKREPFSMKELSIKLHKEKGITQQSVEEVIKELVDDGLVENEKIGTNSLYWSFPAKAKQMSENKVNSLRKQLADQQTRLAELREQSEEYNDMKKPSASRAAKKQKLAELKAQLKKLVRIVLNQRTEHEIAKQPLLLPLMTTLALCYLFDQKKEADAAFKLSVLCIIALFIIVTAHDVQEDDLHRFSENDPAKVSEIEEKLGWLKDTANRWIDNLVTTLQFMKTTHSLDDAAVKALCKELGIQPDIEPFE